MQAACLICLEQTRIQARGLCIKCYRREYERGSVANYPKLPRVSRKCSECASEVQLVAHGLCAVCYRRGYNANHKSEHAEWMREWRKNRPEKAQAIERKRSQTSRRKAWRDTYNENYYQEHRDELCAYQVEWRKANPEQFAIYWRAAYARGKNAEGKLLKRQWKAIVEHYAPDGRCPKCGEPFSEAETRRRLSIDHVLPLSQGGRHSPENIQVLCHSCNSSKNDKTVDYRPDQGEFCRTLR